MLGAVPVPVYADSVADEIALVLDARRREDCIVAQDQEQVDKAAVDRSIGCRNLDARHLRRGARPRRLRRAAAALARRGDGRRAAPRSPTPRVARALDARIDAGEGDDPSVMLYTSGTTGRSKGVVLSAASAASRRRATPSPSTI